VEAVRAKLVSRVIVSSDEDETRLTAIQYGAEAPFSRPPELSTDTARPIDGDQHALFWAEADEGREYDYFVELLATNPMKTSDDIDAALQKLIDTGADSVIAVTRLDDHHPIRIKKIVDDRIADFCLPEIPETRRQDLKPDAYIRAGAIYGAPRHMTVKGIRYGTLDSRPYILTPDKAVNVDSEEDLLLAQLLLRKNPRPYVQPVMSRSEAQDRLDATKALERAVL
jgi:CMP-N-acetylneuraminic acid synthetase